MPILGVTNLSLLEASLLHPSKERLGDKLRQVKMVLMRSAKQIFLEIDFANDFGGY